MAYSDKVVDHYNNPRNVGSFTQGTPGGNTETLSYFIYRTAFKSFEQGYASAASVLLLIATVVLAQTLVRRFFKSGVE